MIRMNGELVFVSLYYVLLPALFVHIDSTFVATINTPLASLPQTGHFMTCRLRYFSC